MFFICTTTNGRHLSLTAVIVSPSSPPPMKVTPQDVLTTTASSRDGHRPDRIRLQQIDRPPWRRFLKRFRASPTVVYGRRVAVVRVTRTSSPGRCRLIGRLMHCHIGTCRQHHQSISTFVFGLSCNSMMIEDITRNDARIEKMSKLLVKLERDVLEGSTLLNLPFSTFF